MGRMSIALAGLVGIALAVPLPAVGSAHGQAARVGAKPLLTDLGTLGGATSSAGGISDNGWIAGTADRADGTQHAFLWRKGEMRDLGTLPGGTSSSGVAVNERGDVVGSSVTEDSPLGRATLWPRHGDPIDLGTFGGTISSATDINNRGEVVGLAGAQFDTEPLAFRWRGGPLEMLGNLGGGPFSRAAAINQRGQIVGDSLVFDPSSGFATHAFLYDDGTMTDLGVVEGADNSTATDINDRGWVVGGDFLGLHPFLYRDGTMTDLGFAGTPLAINNRGALVGSLCVDPPACNVSHAFLYENGVLTDLNALLPAGSGWVLTTAGDINDRGEIVGTGTHDGVQRAYLLAPGSKPPKR